MHALHNMDSPLLTRLFKSEANCLSARLIQAAIVLARRAYQFTMSSNEKTMMEIIKNL